MAPRLSLIVAVLLLILAVLAAAPPRAPDAGAAIGFYPGELCLRHSRLHRCA